MKKRILSLIIISAMLAVFIPAINAEEKTDSEKVTLIVEVKGEAALETAEAVLMGASEFNETDTSARRTARIISAQERVQSDIRSKVDRKADIGFTYTNVLNGFSVTVKKSDIDKIKALPNVENVYISGTHKYIEPVEDNSDNADSSLSDNCCKMINVPYMHELGYKGQGQAIAVIDSELDVNHEFFASPIESPKYSKSDITKLINEKNLNVKVSANQVWRSDKIPFAYSYAKNSSDVYSTFLVHGSHVCGIAAGKNGTREDGTKFSGVAPEAQIIFMGVLRDSENLPDDAIIAAIDDASKMDIAAINMSLGADYTLFGGGLNLLFEKVINNAVNAGIEVCVASGNAGQTNSNLENIDYSASGLPAVVSSSTAVASVSGNDGKISYFSSWGTDTTLNLKPEITTPGGYIYSSIPDDKYDTYSGTSMATPHMTGAAALMRQYIEENYRGKYENPALFMENLAMTGANIIYQNDTDKIPYSPRNQGAGLIDLKAAATTPVILSGTDGKTKISLRDKLTDTFQIKFTARNFTDTDVTYDTITPSVFTDDYNGQTRNKKAKKLSFTVLDKPESITVPANGEAEIKFTVELDSTETAENLKIFTNGFFLDGFIELLNSSVAVPAISIPYTGFYGDWTGMSAFLPPYYTGADARSGTGLGSHRGKCICSNDAPLPALRPYCEFIGRNQILKEHLYRGTISKEDIADINEYDSEEFAGISPNGDGELDFLCVKVVPCRPMENCRVRIENTEGEVMDVKGEQNENDGFAVLQDIGSDSTNNAPLDKYDKNLINCTDYNDLSSLPDGDYTVYVTGNLSYEGAQTEEISMKFYIDTIAPEITQKEIREEDGKTYLDISMSDNRYVMGAKVNGQDVRGINFEKSAYTKAAPTGDVSIDVTDLDISTLKITVFDYAYNKTECDVAGDITVTMLKKPVFNENSTVMSFDILNETFKTVTADIIAAVYGENGVLKTALIKRAETIPKGESVQEFNFTGDFTNDKVKIMIFDSLEKMRPIGFGESFEVK